MNILSPVGPKLVHCENQLSCSRRPREEAPERVGVEVQNIHSQKISAEQALKE